MIDRFRSPARRGIGPGLLLTTAFAMVLLAGCAMPPPYRGPSDYNHRFRSVETITLVPPLVAVYSMSSGNVQEEVQDWSDVANELAQVLCVEFP